MRYFIQFAVPVLIFALVTWGVLGWRRKRAESPDASDGTLGFILILAIGATVAIILFITLGDLLA